MSSVAGYIIQTLVTVVAIAALAVLVLYGARRIGVGRPTGPLQLVGRLPLDGRRAVYLVRAAQTVYVVCVSEASVLKLGELNSDEVRGLESEPMAGSFAAALSRVLHHKGQAREDQPSDVLPEPAGDDAGAERGVRPGENG